MTPYRRLHRRKVGEKAAPVDRTSLLVELRPRDGVSASVAPTHRLIFNSQAQQPASQAKQNQPLGLGFVSGLDYGATGLGIFEDYISVRKRA